MTQFLVIIYNLILLIGTAYLVQWHNWSMWTFLLAAVFFMSTKSGKTDD